MNHKLSLFLIPLIAFFLYSSSGITTESRIINSPLINTETNTNTTCEVCHVLVNIVDKEVKLGNKTISDIINIVSDICHIIGGPASQECAFIVDNLQKIINFISHGIPTNEICVKLGLCNATKYDIITKIVQPV